MAARAPRCAAYPPWARMLLHLQTSRRRPRSPPGWARKVEGAPRPIGYIPAAPVAGRVSGLDLRRKVWPELIALFFIGVVFNPLTYISLASSTWVSDAGGYVFYIFMMITTVTLGLPLFLWVGALTYTLVRVSLKYRALKWEAMPLGSFWFYLVYDRLPRDAEEMQWILGAASSMSSAAALTPQPPNSNMGGAS